jgi:serine/threonine-protein kinase
MESTSSRALFDRLIDLDPTERVRALDASDLDPGRRTGVVALLAFDAIVCAPIEARPQVLRSLSLAGPALERLHAMLASDRSVADLLRETAGEAIRLIDSTPDAFGSAGLQLVGKRFGDFTICSLIAEGGSSAVFRAERAVGDGVQVVALKVLRTGLFSRESQRRFGREQAILAQLEHPNIARLVEGGVGDAGIPYIAMELVDGVPVTRAANARRLGLRQRLEWMVTLCRAIEAAHAALVVHRDIKPSNVLVTHDGRIKVLDFGIAKLLDDDARHVTRTIALTPEYAAPEQFAGRPVSMATDVYALGVLLGELVVGVRVPAHRRASSLLSTTPPPSVPAGMPSPRALARLVDGDLDAILAMATSEDPRNRYPTAAAFGDDLARYLVGEPVHARPLTRRYRLRKFVARHRAGVGRPGWRFLCGRRRRIVPGVAMVGAMTWCRACRRLV